MKKSGLRKITAYLLTFFLLLGMLPENAFAAIRCRHDGSSYWKCLKGELTHVKICGECGARIKSEEHDKFDDSKWNFTYDAKGHHQSCKKCGYTVDYGHTYARTSAKVHGKTHGNVLVCTESKCKYISGGDQTKAYCVFDCQYVNAKYHKNTCVYCDYTVGNSPSTQKDYVEHNWVFQRNNSAHWYECSECHAVMDKSGHHFRQEDSEDWIAEKTILCDVCGWVKSRKVSTERNDNGHWINWKETVEKIPADELPKPGPEDNKYECNHSYDTYYVSLGEKHEEHCEGCGKTLRTVGCSYTTETVKKAAEAWLLLHPDVYLAHQDDYMSYSPLIIYLEDYFEAGHYKVCSYCNKYVLVPHNWGPNGANADANYCRLTCKDCGWTMTHKYRLDKKDPSPHECSVTYQENFWVDADWNIHDPEECSFTPKTATTHKAKCNVCGYEFTERCDTDGFLEIPGQPGKHWQFCSKCGGGKKIVECDRYCSSANNTIGHHSVMCPTCGDIYIPTELCQLYLDSTKTDTKRHTYRCTMCDTLITDLHVIVRIKENVVAATKTKDGSYDLVERCQICGKEITRTKVTIPKTDNSKALPFVYGDYTVSIDKNIDAPGTGARPHLEGTITVDGISEYLANNSKTLLRGVTALPATITGYSEDGKEKTINTSSNSSANVLLRANIALKVTGYERNAEADLDFTDQPIFLSMTSKFTITYCAYYSFTENGVKYVSRVPVNDADGKAILNLPLDLTGTSIKMSSPLLAGMYSTGDTIIVGHSPDGSDNYDYFVGTYIADSGIKTATFTTEAGFDGSFRFVVSKHWLTHVPAVEPTYWVEGNTEFWYSKLTDKYFSDIFCKNEISFADTRLAKLLILVSFDKNDDNAKGTMENMLVSSDDVFILPECSFTLEGYEFVGWQLGECVYRPGDRVVLGGKTVFYARWKSAADTWCTITFDANGGSGTMDDLKIVYPDYFKLPECTFTKEGMGFRGWTEIYGGKEYSIYSEGAERRAVFSEMTYRAKWCPMFTISFDANGGEGTALSQDYTTLPSALTDSGWEIEPGSKAPANTYTREGYTFLGWALTPDATTAKVNDGGDVCVGHFGGDTTFYAVWQKDVLDVTFDAGSEDATGTTEAIRADRDINFLVPECGFTREGYIFDHWTFERGGYSLTVRPGTQLSVLNDTVLTAVWVEAVNISFDANGGDGEMDTVVFKNEGRYNYLPYNTFTRDGYAFDSWNTKADGSGTKYSDHPYKQWTEDLTLYAQWKQVRFTISYDANGGEGEMDVQTVDFGNGYSSICPRCSSDYTVTLSAPYQSVHFCNCCGLSVIKKDEGATDGLAVRSYGSFVNFSLYTRFDEIASLYAALLALYPDKDFTRISDNGSEEYAAYATLYAKAAEVMNASCSEITKDLGYTVGSSAIIGVSDSFVLTPADNEFSFDENLGALARLFGYDDTAEFLEYADNLATVLLSNEEEASTSARLKYKGAVYTANGSFVLPYAFYCEISGATLLAYVIIDADGSISVWISDLDTLYYASLYGLELPDGADAELEIYGCCTLFEAPKVFENKFSREWYKFDKWNTEPDGSGTSYTSTSTFSSYSLKNDLKLYAQWKVNYSTITFDANGGEGEMEAQKVLNSTPTALNTNTFTREGYQFIGWSTSSTSSYASYTDEAEFKVSKDTKYYAVWKKLYTFTFDANGGYGSMEAQTIPEKTSGIYLNKNAFLHDTLAFDYWSFTPDGERAYSDGTSMYISSEPAGTVLYAIWKTKNDVSGLITLEDAEAVYTGETPATEAAISFENSDFTQGTNPQLRYVYFSGTVADDELRLNAPPTDTGVYTVRAVYEDSKNKGHKDAVLTITKAEREMVSSADFLLLYGRDKSISLGLNDADGSALPEDVIVETDDESIVIARAEKSGKSEGVVLIGFRYVGDGYTKVSFTLPESKNYKEAKTEITVISKSGYDIYLDSAEGGTVTSDNITAAEGSEVNVSTVPKTGYRLENITVTNNTTYLNEEITDGRFIMPEANVTVGAGFVKIDYTITYADVDGVVYTAGLPTIANYGDMINVSAEAGENSMIKAFTYKYGDVTVSVTPDKDGRFSFNMPAKDITVTAITGVLYDVNIGDAITGGNIVASHERAAEGTIVKLVPTAGEGYGIGSITYTAGNVKKTVNVNVDENGEKIYTIVMPAEDITVNAEFIQDETIGSVLDNVNDKAGSEQGKAEAELGIIVDDETADMLQAVADNVDVELNVGNGVRNISDEEKADAVSALTQAGLIDIEENDNQIRVVEKTFAQVTVLEYTETEDNTSLTLEITPMKQTVATATPEGTLLDSENSVALSAAKEVTVNEATTVTIGIPTSIALAAGGTGSVIYVEHEHDGRKYEYPAVISGNETDGFTAEFNNPNGYSEFIINIRSNTVASFEYNSETYRYTSFAQAIEDALEKSVAEITMHMMPAGQDKALITKKTTLSFEAAEGKDIDFDAIYTVWIETDDGIRKTSTPEQLAAHVFDFDSENPVYELSLEVVNPSSVTAPQITVTEIEDGGSYGGETVFTVNSSKACMVLVSTDNGESYVRLEATKTEEEGTYLFTLDVQSEVLVKIILIGDVSLDGKVDSADALQILRHDVGKAPLSSLQLMAANVSGDTKVDSADALLVLRYDVGKTTFNW